MIVVIMEGLQIIQLIEFLRTLPSDFMDKVLTKH